MAGRPQCVVVIPTYNGAHLLRTCLAALLANPPERCDQRLVVVDDASRDATIAMLAEFGDAIDVVAMPENGGFATACNRGAARAGSAEYIIFLNNDTVPVAGWLDALVETATTHPQAGAVGAKLLFPNGTVQHAGVAIGQDGWPRHLYAGFPSDHPAVNRAKRVAVATAACLLVRRPLFEQLGGFDTAFHNGYEDVDLCLRLGELDHDTRYCPDSVVYHLESVTRWPDAERPSTEYNDRLYRARWDGRVTPDDIQHYVDDGLIQIEYGNGHPQRFTIAPELATTARDNGEDMALERLLTKRSEQVMELQSQRIRAALDARLRDEAALTAAPPALTPRAGRRGGVPKLLHTGTTHRVGDGEPRHLVSVVMPLLNAGQALREIVPLLLSQRTPTLLEIVGVDSASEDDTVEVLAGFGGTVIGIDPADFDHGFTRNLAARHAKGDVLVFLNGRTRPVDDNWLGPLLSALDEDPTVAGVCSRVLPHPNADVLTLRDGKLELSGSAERSIKRIHDWSAYRSMSQIQRRMLLNFHTVSAAIRADVLTTMPFRSVRAIGEDLLWAREVLEAGLALVHEPASRAFHSHDYSLREWFERNVDDGIANRDINGRTLDAAEALTLAQVMISSDWRYLREELGMTGDELERWEIRAAMRRTAQVAGQWLGVNHTELPAEASLAFSRVANARRRRS